MIYNFLWFTACEDHRRHPSTDDQGAYWQVIVQTPRRNVERINPVQGQKRNREGLLEGLTQDPTPDDWLSSSTQHRAYNLTRQATCLHMVPGGAIETFCNCKGTDRFFDMFFQHPVGWIQCLSGRLAIGQQTRGRHLPKDNTFLPHCRGERTLEGKNGGKLEGKSKWGSFNYFFTCSDTLPAILARELLWIIWGKVELRHNFYPF